MKKIFFSALNFKRETKNREDLKVIYENYPKINEQIKQIEENIENIKRKFVSESENASKQISEDENFDNSEEEQEEQTPLKFGSNNLLYSKINFVLVSNKKNNEVYEESEEKE